MMIDLELGPVVGQTGGGVEIVEQQFIDAGTVSLPEGWESAYAIAQAASTNGNITGGQMFGWGIPSGSVTYHRAAILRQGAPLAISLTTVFTSASAVVDVTLIRID